MKYNQNDIIIVKLMTGEEVIGRVKKMYHDGGVVLDNARVILTSEIGCFMERFIPFCENDDYEIAPHAMVTVGRPLEALTEAYNKGETTTMHSEIAMPSQAKH